MLGHTLLLRVAAVLVSVALALEPVAGSSHHPGTQGQSNVRVTTVYLSQVSPATYLSTRPQGRMDNWVGCIPTARAGIRTRTRGSVVSHVNHCTTEVHEGKGVWEMG